MNDDFYCSLKLISGEEIFSLICVDENDGDPIIILQNPVIMKIKPWMEIPNDDFYFIKFDRIITMTEINDEMTIEFYNKYLNDDSTDVPSITGEVKISNQMGYISSVEDARKKLEELYKGSIDS